MVALLARLTCPMPSSIALLPYPKSTKFSSLSFATFNVYEPFCSSSCGTSTYRCDPTPLFAQVGFRLAVQFPVRCNFARPLTDIHNEMGMLYSFFRDVGIDEKEMELLLDKNAWLISTPLDSIRHRILALQSVGIDGLELCHLIMKCPIVLTANEIDPFICFVLEDLAGEVEPVQLKRLFNSTEPRFLVGFDKKVSLLLDHGVPQQKIGYVLNNVNLTKAFCLKSVEEIDRTLNFLDRFGGVRLLLKRPAILNCDLESQLVPRIELLVELSGGNEYATGTVLFKLPAIVNYSVKHVQSHIELLRTFAGLKDQEIFKIILGYPNLISASRERKLRPRIQFLKDCGLASEDIFKFLIKAPLFIGLSFEDNLAYKLVFLVKVGYRYRTKDLAVAMGSVTRTSCENMQKVVGLFLDYGFNCADIMVMSKKQPQILQYSYNSLEEKMEYLTEVMGRDIKELLTFPAFLGYKLDDRIKLRYEVKKETTGERISLNKLLTVSPETFSIKRENRRAVKRIDYVNHNNEY